MSARKHNIKKRKVSLVRPPEKTKEIVENAQPLMPQPISNPVEAKHPVEAPVGTVNQTDLNKKKIGGTQSWKSEAAF
jgi:hypothetical protein